MAGPRWWWTPAMRRRLEEKCEAAPRPGESPGGEDPGDGSGADDGDGASSDGGGGNGGDAGDGGGSGGE